MQSESKYLIEPEELIALLKQPLESLKNIRIIDGTSFPPLDPRSREDHFKSSRIPYSILFDVDKVANLSIKIPHMMPTKETFVQFMKDNDIRKSDTVIIYDRVSLFGAPRVWFTFYVYGHRNIKILNGGLPLYSSLNGELELNDDYKVTALNHLRGKCTNDEEYNYNLDQSKVLDLKDIVLNKHNDVIIDARSEERYEGKAQEPRKSLRVGHVEGAISVFFKHLLDDKGRYHSVDKIKSVFIEKGVDLTKDVIAYCGTGLTACIDLFALAMLGREEHIKLYDASWMEYGNKTLEEINAIKNNSV